jgi:predicted PurR-regulated permease PerM
MEHVPLGPRQRATVAAALTTLAALVLVGAMLGTLWLAAVFLDRFSGVFLPLGVGAIAALVFNPYYLWLRRRLRLPAALAVAAVFVSILLPLVALVSLFGSLLVEQVTDVLAQVPNWWRGTVAEIERRLPVVQEFLRSNPLGQKLRGLIEGADAALLPAVQIMSGKALSFGVGLFRLVATLFSWVLLPVYFAFFLVMDWTPGANLDHVLPFLKPETRRDVAHLVREFVNIIVSFFRGQLIIAVAQGLLFALGFTLIGLRYGFALGFMLGLLNTIPYLGSIIGLGFGLPLAYFQQGGGTQLVVLVLVVFTIVQMIEAYVLTPRIMGQRTGLHPLAIIVAVLFWGSALSGILGMILAIPLTAFLVVFWRLLREKYILELI